MAPSYSTLPVTEMNGANGHHKSRRDTYPRRSFLQRVDRNDIHDLICVGFGPASLAIAIALHDGLDGLGKTMDLGGPNGKKPKVTFLEKQDQFAWHSGMLIDGAKMQITFIKDMATLRNPRSRFTFLNYLHENDRLIEFTNLDTFLPQRIEFEDYLRWCASFFDDVVHYSQEVVDVRSDGGGIIHGKAIKSWIVTSRNSFTGEISELRTRNVVVAAGGRPSYPAPFREHPFVIHSSQYIHRISDLLPERHQSYRIAVIGSGQSAAEIFHDLQKRYPNSSTNLIIKSAVLRPSDDSPFVNEIFAPSRVTPFYTENAEWRQRTNRENRSTNYGVVRLNLLEQIYESLYMQRITHGNDESSWPHRILANSTITELREPSPGFNLRLRIRKPAPASYQPNIERKCRCPVRKWLDDELDFDAVILGTGYERDAYKHLLAPLEPLRPLRTADVADLATGDASNGWKVRRDYSIEFAEGAVEPGCGVWLQGCCEDSHGLADTLLSILAVRGGEIVNSIFGSGRDGDAHHARFDAHNQDDAADAVTPDVVLTNGAETATAPQMS